MTAYEFSIASPVNHNMCGKFVAPNPEWMHLTRELTDFELILVTDGTLYIGDSHGKYTIEKGHYYLMAPTQFQHGYRPSNCSFYWMHFTPTSPAPVHTEDSTSSNDGNSGNGALFNTLEIDELAADISPNTVILPKCGELNANDRLIVLMKQLQDSDKRYHEHNLNNYIATTLLCEINNQSFLYKRYNTANIKNQLYNDIADYVSWHICENIKVSEIADYFGYNEKYLSTFFHRMSGIPLKQHILQSKMDHAKAELSDTNRTISQIAFNIGFSDPHNFTNAFKKITGLTPTEYRTSYAKRMLYYE